MVALRLSDLLHIEENVLVDLHIDLPRTVLITIQNLLGYCFSE
jgi:hypothetical protein